MKEDKDILELLDKAERSTHGAEILFKEGLYDFSASRPYYAMFYGTEALLLTRNLSFSSHKAVIAAFGKEFIKPRMLPSYLHRNLRDAFRLRQAGDYGTAVAINEKEGQRLITQAKELINDVRKYLRKEGYSM